MGKTLPPHPAVEAALGVAKPTDGTSASAPAPAPANTRVGVTSDGDKVICFKGYAGEVIEHDGVKWQVLYIDANFGEWLLIDSEDIAGFKSFEEYNALCGQRDYVWVKENGAIARGNADTTLALLFLSGAFTRAGDFATSIRGDTISSASGLICEAITPGGCGSNTNKK